MTHRPYSIHNIVEKECNSIADFYLRYGDAINIPVTLFSEKGCRVEDYNEILTLRTVNKMYSAAMSLISLYNELTDILVKNKEYLQTFFDFSDTGTLLWVLSDGNWHSIARADIFIKEDESIAIAELNSDTPSGIDDAYVLGKYVEQNTEYVNVNMRMENHFISMIFNEWESIEKIGKYPSVGIVYPTDMPEDCGMLFLYRKWLENAGCSVVMGSPYNLMTNDRNRTEMFGKEIDVMMRHFKTDWWCEKRMIWKSEANDERIDYEPLLRELASVLIPYKEKKLTIVNPFGSILTQNKKTFAFFHEHIALFSETAQQSIRNYIPYTVCLKYFDVQRLQVEKDRWVLKSDYGCEGAEVIIGELTDLAEWEKIILDAVEDRWVVQEKFTPQNDDRGKINNYGIYVIKGNISGIYLRRSYGQTNTTSNIAPISIRVPFANMFKKPSQINERLRPEIEGPFNERCTKQFMSTSEWAFLQSSLFTFSDYDDSLSGRFTENKNHKQYRKAAKYLSDHLDGRHNEKSFYICDVVGEYAVAFFTELTASVEIIVQLANVSHKKEVVPTSKVISAMKYYNEICERKLKVKNVDTNPFLIIDRNRLSNLPHSFEFFNNRYLANLPSKELLLSSSIHKVVYIKPTIDDEVNYDCRMYFQSYQQEIDVYCISVDEIVQSFGSALDKMMKIIA